VANLGKRRITYLLVYLSVLVAVGVSLYFFIPAPLYGQLGKQNPLLPLLVSLLAPVLLSIGSTALRPIREFLETWVTQDLDRSICRIYLFGHRGSGKTSIIKNIFTADSLAPEASTVDFDYYQRDLVYDLQGYIHFRVLIADYKGEQPSMVIVDLPEEFAGPPHDRAINVIFFVVDLIPRVLDETGRVQKDDETLSWLRTDTRDKIRKRVMEHLDYLTAPMLQVVFASVHSPQLRSVRLVITKLDLVRSAFDQGYLTCEDHESLEEWILGHFTRVEHDIRRACEANGIRDFSAHMVSSTQDTGMRTMFSELWSYHLRSTGVRVK
jgi:hypothetical protein